MHVVAFAGAQSFGQDRIQEARGGAVIEELWRLLGLAFNGDGFSRMPLHGANAQAIVRECEALLVVAADNRTDQLKIGKRPPVSSSPCPV